MAHRLLVSALLLAVVCGCGQESVPTDLTQAALHQVRSGQYDEAIASASAAISVTPQAPAPYLYRGRAYHFRGAMGDHQRALADFGEAIRLAPKSSDAYYSRALVYRDIGQSDLAASDETAARELDGLIQDTYEKLPDLTPSSAIARASEDNPQANSAGKTAGAEPMGEDDQPGFGELRTPSMQKEEGKASAGGVTEESLADRYRNLLGGTTAPAEETQSGATGQGGISTQGQFGQPGQSASTSPAPGVALTPDLPLTPGTATGPAQPRGNWLGPQVPPLTSPFAQRPGASPPAIQLPSGLQSPFPQRAAGATGYVEPVNPFGARPGQSTVSRPFTTQTPSSRFSNPAVRPDNPRDYIP